MRADTPGTDHRIHLNNAGASLMPRPVINAVVSHLELEAAIGGYEAAEAESERLAAVYDSLAKLFGCAPSEIGVLENATRAWQAVFYALRFRCGDRIVTGRAEYSSNYMMYRHAIERRGVSVAVIDDDESGSIDLEQLAAAIDDRVRLIAMTHVPTDNGLVNPVEAVGRIARAAGVPYLLDACQSMGQIPLDVDAIGCDFLTAAGRKFLRGPRGTGVLYVRRERLEALQPAIPEIGAMDRGMAVGYSLKDDAKRFETWEASYAARLGLGSAADYALDLGQQAIWVRIRLLGALLRETLAALPAVSVHDRGREQCGIVAFSVAHKSALEVKAHLAGAGINVDVASVETAGDDLRMVRLDPVVRAAVHCFNTEDEIAALREALQTLIQAGPTAFAARS